MQAPPDPPQTRSEVLTDGDVEAGPPVTRRPRPKLALAVIGVLTITFIAVGTWATYWADLRNDQYQHIHLGQTVYNGGRMYVDCWENKPPGIAWINALGLALGGGRQVGAWLLPGVTALACLAIMGYAMARLLSTAAACSTLLVASVVCTLRLYDTPSINPDFYSAMFELAACSLWLVSLDSAGRACRTGSGLAAGLIWAASAGIKQTGVVGLLAVSAVTLVLALLRRPDSRRWAASCALVWIGFALGAGAVVGVLAYRETLGPAAEAVFGFNQGLFRIESLGNVARSWPRVWAGLAPIQFPLWLGLLGIIVTVRTSRANRLSQPFIATMMLWWIVQVAAALTGPSRSMRYWQATFPAMLWLSGVGIYHLEDILRRLEKGYRSALIVVCATVVLLLARPLVDHYKHGLAGSYLTYSEEDTQRSRLVDIGDRIRALVPAGRPIYVWAYDAGVYLYSSRRAASTFTYPRSPGQMRAILGDLASGQAQAILIPEDGAPEFDRWCDEACHRQRDEILTAYEKKATVGRYGIWVQPTSNESQGQTPDARGTDRDGS